MLDPKTSAQSIHGTSKPSSRLHPRMVGIANSICLLEERIDQEANASL